MITLKVDTKRLTLGDLIAIEEETYSARFIRDVLARFAVGEDGEYLDSDAATKLASALSIDEAEQAVKSFGQRIKELQTSAVPPEPSGS